MPDFVYNHDINGLHRRINRFIEEVAKSVSSGGHQVNAFDQSRLSTYLGAIESYLDWMVGQPQLDLPETHPRQYALRDEPDFSLDSIENESAVDMINLLLVARDEITNSTSARDAAGMNRFDEARLRAVVAKAQAFLAQYISQVTPLDLPESTPLQAMTQPGRTGV